MDFPLIGKQNRDNYLEGSQYDLSMSHGNGNIIQSLPPYAELIRSGCCWQYFMPVNRNGYSAFPPAANATLQLCNDEPDGGKSVIILDFGFWLVEFGNPDQVAPMVYIGTIKQKDRLTSFQNTPGGAYVDSTKYKSLSGKRNYNGNTIILDTYNLAMNTIGSGSKWMPAGTSYTGRYAPINSSGVSTWVPRGRFIIPPTAFFGFSTVDYYGINCFWWVTWAEVQLDITF